MGSPACTARLLGNECLAEGRVGILLAQTPAESAHGLTDGGRHPIWIKPRPSLHRSFVYAVRLGALRRTGAQRRVSLRRNHFAEFLKRLPLLRTSLQRFIASSCEIPCAGRAFAAKAREKDPAIRRPSCRRELPPPLTPQRNCPPTP